MFGIDNYNAPGWREASLTEPFRQSPLDPQETDLYQFGVFLGGSLVTLHDALTAAGRKIPRFIGFDSFEGIPPEEAEPLYQGAWAADYRGTPSQVFHPHNWIGNKNPEETAEWVSEHVLDVKPDLHLVLISGWFDEILTDEDIDVDFAMKPAFYIDFDADIYSSTKVAYDFMANCKLIIPGTIIGFDDWGGAPNRGTLGGEARAHAEALQEWGIKGHLEEFNFYDDRLQQAYFIVESVDS